MHEQPRSGAVAVADDDEEIKSESGFLTSDRQQASSLTPEHRKLLANWQAAKDRCEINRQLTDWIIAFLYHDCSVDHRALQAEWERFKLCFRLARERRP
jgi:glycerol-3-phosphate dehydrogenase